MAPPKPKQIDEVAAESKTKEQGGGAPSTDQLLVPPDVKTPALPEAAETGPTPGQGTKDGKHGAGEAAVPPPPPPPPPPPANGAAPPAEAAAPPPPPPPADEAAPPPPPAEETAPPPPPAPAEEAAPPPPPAPAEEKAPPPPAEEMTPHRLRRRLEETAPPPPPAPPVEETAPKLNKGHKPKAKEGNDQQQLQPNEALPPPPSQEESLPPPRWAKRLRSRTSMATTNSTRGTANRCSPGSRCCRRLRRRRMKRRRRRIQAMRRQTRTSMTAKANTGRTTATRHVPRAPFGSMTGAAWCRDSHADLQTGLGRWIITGAPSFLRGATLSCGGRRDA